MVLEAIRRALKRHDDAHERSFQHRSLFALVSRLTPREREVFDLVVRGKLNKQIANRLGAAARTVKAHRSKIAIKLGTGSHAQLVMISERLGNTQDPANRGLHHLVESRNGSTAKESAYAPKLAVTADISDRIGWSDRPY